MGASDGELPLSDAELVAVAEASIPDAKRLVERCLEHEIPARLGGKDGCATGGCSPKAQLMVRAEDVPRVVELMRGDWLEAAEREGTIDPAWLEKQRAAASDPDAEPPCPACGTAAPLVDGACSDCGLQLE